MRRSLVAWAVLSAALAVLMMVTPGVANAASDRGGKVPVNLPFKVQAGGMDIVAAEQSGSTTEVTFAPKGADRSAQQVTCQINTRGPESPDGGITVEFWLEIDCLGTVMDQLIADITMAKQLIPTTAYVPVPGANKHCEILNDDKLPCLSTAQCLPADNYVGYGDLQAYLDQIHSRVRGSTGVHPVSCAIET